MHDPGREDTMYSICFVLKVWTMYPCIHFHLFFTYYRGWVSLYHYVSVYPHIHFNLHLDFSWGRGGLCHFISTQWLPKHTWCMWQFVYIENCMGKSPIVTSDRWFSHTIFYIHKLSHTQHILSLGCLWSSYPLQTTLRLFLPEVKAIISRGGVVFATSYPRIHTLQGSTFKVAGYSAVTSKVHFSSSPSTLTS